MPKKFAFSLIVLSTVVYGSIFLMANHYGTGFFDEILIQLNRMTLNLSKKQEVDRTRLILKTILENEHPPASWNSLIARSRQKDHKELFYYYKIWSIKSKLSLKDISRSYPIFESNKDHYTLINMRYGNTKPVLQFPFFKNKAGKLVAGLFFPINEAPMSADYNNDKIINYEDVVLARKEGT